MIGTLLQALPALAGGYMKYRAGRTATQPLEQSAGERQAEQLMGMQLPLIQQYGDYSRMMANPNDPTFQALVRQEEGDIAGNFAAALNQAVTENRRQQGLGRTPLFDAERGGEVRFRAMMNARNDARSQAQQAALKRLGLAADATSNMANMYQRPISNYFNLGDLQQARTMQNMTRQAARQSSYGDMLGSQQASDLASALVNLFTRGR